MMKTVISTESSEQLSLPLINRARQRIRDFVRRTPVMTSGAINELAGAQLYFKCENFQKGGAFKARGAHNAVFSLTDTQARAGVVTHSSGNHATALALAARSRQVPAFIVMPANAPEVKKQAVARAGGQITLCEPSLKARESTAARLLSETGGTMIHPYNDVHVMAGQGTVAIELLEEIPQLDCIVCPVSGGGLLSGIAVAAKAMRPTIRVIGAEPAGADDAYRSFRTGILTLCENPHTIADGLRGSLGDKTFPLIRSHVDDIITASEDEIVRSMRLVWEVMKIVIEPSAAVGAAVVLERKLAPMERIGVILTGGNVDLAQLPWQI